MAEKIRTQEKATFGAFLRERRKNMVVSVQDVASGCGISKESVYNYEAGFSSPTLFALVRMCDFLGISPAEAFAVGRRAILEALGPQAAQGLQAAWMQAAQRQQAAGPQTADRKRRRSVTGFSQEELDEIARADREMAAEEYAADKQRQARRRASRGSGICARDSGHDAGRQSGGGAAAKDAKDAKDAKSAKSAKGANGVNGVNGAAHREGGALA